MKKNTEELNIMVFRTTDKPVTIARFMGKPLPVFIQKYYNKAMIYLSITLMLAMAAIITVMVVGWQRGLGAFILFGFISALCWIKFEENRLRAFGKKNWEKF